LLLGNLGGNTHMYLRHLVLLVAWVCIAAWCLAESCSRRWLLVFGLARPVYAARAWSASAAGAGPKCRCKMLAPREASAYAACR
jgi:hypothetical protein